MERVIAAGLVAMVLSIIVGPKFIEFLRRNELGQQIREEGPPDHRVKQGTPVMGGVLIVLAATLPFLVLSEYSLSALTVLAVTIACAAIGFVDDFIKVRRRRSLGLAGRWKLLLLGAITVFLVLAAREQGLDTDLYVPAVGQIDLWWLWYPLVFFIVAGAANGREPDRRPRRAGRRHGDHRAADLHGDQRDRVHPRAGHHRPRPRHPGRRADRRRRSDSSGTTPSRPRSSWATPARWRSAERWPASP